MSDFAKNIKHSTSPYFTNNKSNKSELDSVFKTEVKKKLAKIKLIRDFFSQEKDQVETIILLILSAKKEHPLGIKLDKIIQDLHDVDRYYLFGNNTYLLSVLNTLAMPALGILLVQQLDGAFDITSFGLDYYHETQRV